VAASPRYAVRGEYVALTIDWDRSRFKPFGAPDVRRQQREVERLVTRDLVRPSRLATSARASRNRFADAGLALGLSGLAQLQIGQFGPTLSRVGLQFGDIAMLRRREIGRIGCMVVLTPLLGCAHESPLTPEEHSAAPAHQVSESATPVTGDDEAARTESERFSAPGDLEGVFVRMHLNAQSAPAESPGSPKLVVKFDGERWVFSINAKDQPARVIMVVDPGERGDVDVYLPAHTYEEMGVFTVSPDPPYRKRASSRWWRPALSLVRPPSFRAGRLRSSDF